MPELLRALLTVSIISTAVLALAAVTAGPSTVAGVPLMCLLAIAALAVQWLVFVPSCLARTEHLYDLTGSLTFVGLTWAAVHAAGAWHGHPRALLLAVLVSVWALRLGGFLFLRIRREGKDARFDRIKRSAPDFLVAWTLQGAWVFVTLLAALIAITGPASGIDAWAVAGAGLWALGFGIEVLADAQKSRFRADPGNRGRFIDTGLWRWSRHPNYFGEMLLWTGIAIAAVPSFSGWQWLGLLSPAFVMLLLTRVSGVPLTEARAESRWGADPDYQRYKQRTPLLFPRPPRD